MKKEAEMHAEEDRKAREKADKVNMADSLIFQTEKQLKEWGDKLEQGTRENIDTALEALKKSHKEENVAQIEKDAEALNAALQKAGEEIYKNQQAAGADAGQQQAQGDADASSQAKGGDNVQDVDFEEVK